MDEVPHAADGPCVCLVFPAVDEGDEAGGVQATIGHATLQPGLLEAQPGQGPPAGVGPQQQAHKVPGGLAHALEVVPGEAEVQPADVQTRLLCALIKEGRGATQQHIGHHPPSSTGLRTETPVLPRPARGRRTRGCPAEGARSGRC